MALLVQRIQSFYQWVLDNGGKLFLRSLNFKFFLILFIMQNAFQSVEPNMYKFPCPFNLLAYLLISTFFTCSPACLLWPFCTNKRTDPWFLVYSPMPIIVIFLFYLLCVWAGPKIMKNREPVKLTVVLIGYNFGMVCLSAYMFHEFFVTAWLANYSLLCQPVDYSNSVLSMRMAKVCWWFFFSKVIELSDTFFFILRKKNSQLTFLHVYHHGTMIFNWWAGVKYVAGGQSFLIGSINTFVHIIMYLYYGLAALGPHIQRYLWWKRYLTSLQLVQFLIVTVHSGYNYFVECDFPDSMNAVVLAYSVSLIVLFANFYYQNYLSKRGKRM